MNLRTEIRLQERHTQIDRSALYSAASGILYCIIRLIKYMLGMHDNLYNQLDDKEDNDGAQDILSQRYEYAFECAGAEPLTLLRKRNPNDSGATPERFGLILRVRPVGVGRKRRPAAISWGWATFE